MPKLENDLILKEFCGNVPKVYLLYEDECGKLMAVSAIFGYYSRSHDKTPKLIERAWRVQEDGREAYKRFIEQYVGSEGHDSLSDHPPIFVYVEDVSNFAVKILEHSDLTVKKMIMGVMEKSTRFINFDTEECRKVFFNSFISKHKSLQDKMNKIFNKRMDMYNKMNAFYKGFIDLLNENLEDDEKLSPKLALDSSRYELPYGLKTTCGLTFNGRSAKKKLVELLISPFDEIKLIGEQLLELLNNKFPYLIKKEEILLEVKAELEFEKLQLERVYMKYKYGETEERGRAKSMIKDIKVEEMKALIENKDDLEFLGEGLDPNRVFIRNSNADIYQISKPDDLNQYEDASTYEDTRNIIYDISRIKKDDKFSKCKLNNAYEKLQKSIIYDELKGFDIVSDIGAFRDIHRNRGISVSFKPTVGINFNKDEKYFEINRIFSPYFISDIIAYAKHTEVRKIGLKLDEVKRSFECELAIEVRELINEICSKFEEEKDKYNETEYSFVIARYNLIREVLSYLVPLGMEIDYTIQGTTSNLIEFVFNRTQKGAHRSYSTIAFEIGDILSTFYDVSFNVLFPNKTFHDRYEKSEFSNIVNKVFNEDEDPNLNSEQIVKAKGMLELIELFMKEKSFTFSKVKTERCLKNK